jgi:hypothetical protein
VQEGEEDRRIRSAGGEGVGGECRRQGRIYADRLDVKASTGPPAEVVPANRWCYLRPPRHFHLRGCDPLMVTRSPHQETQQPRPSASKSKTVDLFGRAPLATTHPSFPSSPS